ncbi:MAG: energy transducer TonB [Acidobacteriaceae bacterium]
MVFRRYSAWTALLCVGLLAGNAAAQTQPAAGPPAAAPTTPLSSAKTAAAPLPDPQTPEEFFARARALSDLEASGTPFHLKATYIASGDAEFTGNGTYEEWWQSKDLWRKEATLGNYTYVVINNGGKTSAYGSSDYVPLRLRQAMDAVLVRIPADAGASGEWEKRHQQLSGVDLTVVSFKPCMPAKFMPNCGVQNYFTSEGVLRIHVASAVETFYNGLQSFRNLLISRAVDVTGAQGKDLVINLNLLEPLRPDEQILSKGPPLLAASKFIMPPPPLIGRAGIQAPRVVHEVEPVIPPSERGHFFEGAVVIACAIDTKGVVREPYVQVSAGTAFDRSALEAVRQYRFKPAEKNGEPVMVLMDISINFRVTG